MERIYESMLLIRSDLGDDARDEVTGKITQKIEDMGGKILNSRIWAKERNFCYFIKDRSAEKKKHFKGTYWLVYFSLDTDNLPGLKETIRLEERILRNIMIKREEYTAPQVIVNQS